MTVDQALQALKLISESWPLAAAAVGITIALVVRRCFKQALTNEHEKSMDRAQGNKAVVVHESSH